MDITEDVVAELQRRLRRVEGQVLWTLEGTEPLRRVAQECLQRMARHDATVVGPGSPGTAVPVTAMPLRAADGAPYPNAALLPPCAAYPVAR